MNEDERNYYNQLHETLRIYQKELWGAPVLFFGLEGFIFFEVFTNNLFAWKNVIFLINLLSLVMVHIYFEKIRDRSSILQNKIDEFDSYSVGRTKTPPERIPLYRGKYNLLSIIRSSSLDSATTWFRTAILLFAEISLIFLIY